MAWSARAPRGFTLVELMVSLVLFSVAMAGVLSVAVSIGQGFREQRAAVATESQVRVPMDFLTDAIRQAGPAVPTAASTVAPPLPATNVWDVTNCDVGAINVVNGGGPNNTDVLDLVYASGAVATSTLAVYPTGSGTLPVADASQFVPGDLVLISNLDQGHTMTVSAVDYAANTLTVPNPTCGNASFNLPPGGYPMFSTIVRVQRAEFTIVLNTPGVAPPDGIPILMMDPNGWNGSSVTGPSVQQQPLAEGIEDLQIALGVDVNGNGMIDPTEWALDKPGDGPLVGPILAVKVALVGRATTQISGAGQGTPGYAPFIEPPAFDHTAPLNGPDVYRRRELQATVELRNMGGSP